jgi:mono/diheme cytochrome c family protein
MHCRATTAPVGGLACYVRNYGTFGGTSGDAFTLAVAAGPPLATVAMVYTPPIDAPNAVTFMVYGPDGTRVNEAQLDTRGDNKSIPQNCLNCHGGRSSYNTVTHAAIGARFLPFDPAAFAFDARADLTLAAQEEKLRRFNRMVANAAPTIAERELVEGMFPVTNAPYDPAFVPVGWSDSAADKQVYLQVVAPYCRGCHASFENGPADPSTFATAAGFKLKAGPILTKVCGTGPKGMPTAEQTTRGMFTSSARALLLPWLDKPGACAPL